MIQFQPLRRFFTIRCNSLSFRFMFNEQGGAAVETALLLPLILAGGLLCVDLFKVGLERTRMEQLAGSAAMTLSVQQKLGKVGLDGLYETLFHVEGLKDVRGRHQMVVSNITMPSRQVWWSLTRGGDGICEDDIPQSVYEGALPDHGEALPGEEAKSQDAYALVVVRLCRSIDDISMDQLALPDKLAVISVNRALAAKIDLDEDLLAEAVGAIAQEERKSP